MLCTPENSSIMRKPLFQTTYLEENFYKRYENIQLTVICQWFTIHGCLFIIFLFICFCIIYILTLINIWKWIKKFKELFFEK